jgi:hypothetical protein
VKLVREFCDAGCGSEFKDKNHGDRMGLVITMGYSKNGWGNRRNMVNWSGELCPSCYYTLGPGVGEIWEARFANCKSPATRPTIPEARVQEKSSWRQMAIERIKQCLGEIQ